MKKIIFFVFLVVVIGGVLIAYKTYDESIHYVAKINEPVQFTVTEGENFTTLLDDLESKGLIKNKQVIQLYLKINDINPNVKVGEYTIESDLDLKKLIDILEKGVFKPGIVITLKEGLRADEVAETIVAKLGDNAVFNKGEFLAFVNHPDTTQLNEVNRVFLDKYLPAGKPLEGYLFPDTYEFLPEQTTMQILDTILGNFVTKVNDEIDLENLNLPQSEVTTLYEAVTLASIIEKEASNNGSQAEISSVFHNRLRDGIRLQSDATVVYFTGRNDFITSIEDTQIENPYNTYRIDGLTPTPINSPGINAIKSAFYPTASNFYFFFYDEEGNAYFFETFAEHNQKAQEVLGN
jgi:UPF0755 protein